MEAEHGSADRHPEMTSTSDRHASCIEHVNLLLPTAYSKNPRTDLSAEHSHEFVSDTSTPAVTDSEGKEIAFRLRSSTHSQEFLIKCIVLF